MVNLMFIIYYGFNKYILLTVKVKIEAIVFRNINI